MGCAVWCSGHRHCAGRRYPLRDLLLIAVAALRNTVLTIIRRSGRRPVEGFEHYAEHRDDALNAVAGSRTE